MLTPRESLMQKEVRPTSVTLLVILEILAGIESFVMILYVLANQVTFSGNFVIYFTLFGSASLILAYGLWSGRSMAWPATLILSTIGILFWLANLLGIIALLPSTDWGSILDVVIYLVIIFYLTRPQVKAFFKK